MLTQYIYLRPRRSFANICFESFIARESDCREARDVDGDRSLGTVRTGGHVILTGSVGYYRTLHSKVTGTLVVVETKKQEGESERPLP